MTVNVAEFEVRVTDLAGRIGRLSVGSKVLETPAYLPVVHPISQELPVKEMEKIGFKAIMTNSYITMKKYPEGVDVHSLVGFSGIIMTDSGGYQVLEYGDVDANPSQIAEYQVKIGSDIAVILDRPTGQKARRADAERTVNETLKAARESIEFIKKKPPLWAGPIQGGRFTELVKKSAKEMSVLPFDLFAIGSPVEFMNSYRYDEVVKLITAAKISLPPDRPVHLFGAGHPFTIPLAVALGCDLFDSASYILFAKEGKYMTGFGVRELKDLQELPCSCPICTSTDAERFKAVNRFDMVKMLAMHNLYVMKQELEMTKMALREGKLWNYLSYRLRSHPSLASVLRFSRDTLRLFDIGTSQDKKKAFFLYDRYDLLAPEVRRHRERMAKNFRRRSERVTLLVMDNEYDKPYLNMEKVWSKMGQRCDIMVFHPFFSIIPLPILGVYPLVQNIHPAVEDEYILRNSAEFAAKLVKKLGYSSVDVRLYGKKNKQAEMAGKIIKEELYRIGLK